MLEWDGAKFTKASALLKPNTSGYQDLALKASSDYAEANTPWPVNENCGG
jgi:branched-chain amino acid transport system substrate-binding protein